MMKTQHTVDTSSLNVLENEMTPSPDITSDDSALTKAALHYAHSGLSMIPIGQNKKPHVQSLPRDDADRPTWKPFQAKRATVEEVQEWFDTPLRRGPTGVAAVCGQVSGGLLILDFDVAEFYENWCEAVGEMANGLPVQETGRGYQVALKCDEPGRNNELAWLPDESEKTGRRIAIETRAEGGYAVLPPSRHPSGKHYKVVAGDFAAVPHVDMPRVKFLLDAARRLDQAPQTKQQLERAQKAKVKRLTRNNNVAQDIIGQFNEQIPMAVMLHRAGYTASGDRFIRPGGSSPSVVVFDDPQRSFHHSSNDPLHGPHAHDSFSIFCEVEHDGNVKEAVKAAAKELGIESLQNRPEEGEYLADENGIIWLKPTKDGDVPVQLTNFKATITADVIEDDGTEVIHTFEIEAQLCGRTTIFTIPASKFAGLNWAAENLGAGATVYPGFAVKDHARFAIQKLSGDPPRLTVFTHTGWRKVEGDWVYLHAGGAIGAIGPVPNISTALRGSMANYELPDPPDGEKLARALAAAIRLLELGPDRITVPVFCAVWRAAIRSCDFTLDLAGDTGVFKTELAALEQQFFGPAMDARNLPGSWSSTGNSLEAQAFIAKDAILVVDDFAPTGSTYDVQRTHREADRVLRAQGNRSGRGRMRADGSLRPDKPPRGLIVSTGEDVPRGKSLRSRMMILELEAGDISTERLSLAQSDAAAGLYAAVMSAFLKWAAMRYDDIVKELPDLRRKLRDRALADGQHRRTPVLVADLAIGAELFLRFAESVGEITADQHHEIFERCWIGLGEAAAAQSAHQGASDPATRFVELLRSAVVSGIAHLVGDSGEAPLDPQLWGWGVRVTRDEDGLEDRSHWPKGNQIGWVVGENLYLDPDASFNVAQKMAQATGDGIAVTGPTLRRRLKDRGLLASVDGPRRRLLVRKSLQGARRQVLHLKSSTLMSAQDRPNRPNRPNEGEEVASEAVREDCASEDWAGDSRIDAQPSHRTVPQTDGVIFGRIPFIDDGTVTWDVSGSEDAEPTHENRRFCAPETGFGTDGTVGTFAATSMFTVVQLHSSIDDTSATLGPMEQSRDGTLFRDDAQRLRRRPKPSLTEPLTEAEV